MDCLGRETLVGLQEYFFGYDDGVLIDPAATPWSAIGQLEMESGIACSGAIAGTDIHAADQTASCACESGDPCGRLSGRRR